MYWTSTVRFLKVRFMPDTLLQAEAERLRWAIACVRVPEVIGAGNDEGVDWLLTKGLPGHDATYSANLADPEATVAALARGLRRFHELLSVAECPFDARLNRMLGQVGKRAEAGLIHIEDDFHAEHVHLTLEEAVAQLHSGRPSEDDLVVCHGDYCFPNALIEDGEVTGYLDLGELGVADRWSDLAVATWSTTWNVGPGYEELFLEAYGIRPKPERIAYYRLLYDFVS